LNDERVIVFGDASVPQRHASGRIKVAEILFSG
jgi:hypothetical protein